MNKKLLFLLLAVVLFACACCVMLLFIGARLITYRAASACADLSLTPEEAANCGRHTYELEETLTSYCSTMDVDNKVIDATIKFSGNTMTTSIHDWEFAKIASNEYEYVRGKISPTSNINRHVHTITLTMDGFTENYAYEGPEGNLIDCWLDTYTIIK